MKVKNLFKYSLTNEHINVSFNADLYNGKKIKNPKVYEENLINRPNMCTNAVMVKCFKPLLKS